MGSGGSSTYCTILVWSPVAEISPTKNMTPLAGGALKYFSRARIEEMAPWTFLRVPWDLMFDDWENSSRR